MKSENFKISLKAARINAGLSQSDLANKIKVSAATLSKWENRKSTPTLNQLEKISNLTGIPIDYISIPDR